MYTAMLYGTIENILIYNRMDMPGSPRNIQFTRPKACSPPLRSASASYPPPAPRI